MLDWRSRACTAAMAGIYRRLLDRIHRDPAAVLRGADVAAAMGEGVGGGPQPLGGRRMTGGRVVVVGGGLAGLAAALSCADAAPG